MGRIRYCGGEKVVAFAATMLCTFWFLMNAFFIGQMHNIFFQVGLIVELGKQKC